MNWNRLLFSAAVAETAILLITGAILGDAESLLLGVVVAATTAFLWWRRSRVALVIRALVFADVEFFMATAAFTNISHHEAFLASLPAVVLAANSAVGIIATVIVALRGSDAATVAPSALASVAALVLVAGLGLAAANAGSGDSPAPGDAHLSIKSAKYSTTAINAGAGTVAVDITNNDLFWHTFTVDAIHVDERIPVKGHHRVVMTLAPGVYHYYCAIPGHASLGMRGTLTVH